jgi:hypothetical protein
MAVNLTNIRKINKKAIVQYSYPVANIIQPDNKKYEFSLRFNGFNPNFSASFDNTYISGVCVKATVSNQKHNLDGNAELVLEHKKSDNTPFYVVIPLVLGSPNKSGVDVLFLAEEDRLLNLDSDLKKNKSIYCYNNNNNAYIFVFETPIFVQQSKPSLKDFTKFDGMKSNSGFKITNAQNVEDEVVCEYETKTDANASKVDTKLLTTILMWSFILLGLMVCLVFIFTMVANKAEPDSANSVYSVFGVTGFILFIIYVRLFSRTDTKKFEYGAMTFLSIMVLLLSLFAYNGFFKKTII